MAEYFATLRRCELWPSAGPFATSTVSDIARRFDYAATVEAKHKCSAGIACELKLFLGQLSRETKRLLGQVKGITLQEASR